MTTLLRIDSSALSNGSNSKTLADEFQQQWLTQHPDAKVIHRDLAKNPPAHLSETAIHAMYTPADQRNKEQKIALADSEAFLEDLRLADTLLISVPMYNFGIPSSLKAYLDQIIRVGETFAYEATGPKGLLQNKKAVVLLASGGDYTQSPLNQMDFVTPYLKTVLGFIGIQQVEIITAPNMAKQGIEKQTALDLASEQMLATI